MTTKKKAATGKGRAKKLRVRKETLRDLDPKRRGKNVKGGWGPRTVGCPTADCPVNRTLDPLCAVLI